MALLDLQGMELPATTAGRHRSHRSRHCGRGGASRLSLTLC